MKNEIDKVFLDTSENEISKIFLKKSFLDSMANNKALYNSKKYAGEVMSKSL